MKKLKIQIRIMIIVTSEGHVAIAVCNAGVLGFEVSAFNRHLFQVPCSL